MYIIAEKTGYWKHPFQDGVRDASSSCARFDICGCLIAGLAQIGSWWWRSSRGPPQEKWSLMPRNSGRRPSYLALSASWSISKSKLLPTRCVRGRNSSSSSSRNSSSIRSSRSRNTSSRSGNSTRSINSSSRMRSRNRGISRKSRSSSSSCSRSRYSKSSSSS